MSWEKREVEGVGEVYKKGDTEILITDNSSRYVEVEIFKNHKRVSDEIFPNKSKALAYVREYMRDH